MKGRGQLRALPPAQDVFEVDYEITFGSIPVGRSGPGLPQMERRTIINATITARDGRTIPQGQYILTNAQQVETKLAKNHLWRLIN
jgi:hypothetical protein